MIRLDELMLCFFMLSLYTGCMYDLSILVVVYWFEFYIRAPSRFISYLLPIVPTVHTHGDFLVLPYWETRPS